jgi:hypothetical protein
MFEVEGWRSKAKVKNEFFVSNLKRPACAKPLRRRQERTSNLQQFFASRLTTCDMNAVLRVIGFIEFIELFGYLLLLLILRY